MPTFEITLQDGRSLDIDAPDAQNAAKGAAAWAKSNPAKPKTPPKRGIGGEIVGGAMNLYKSIPFVDEGAALMDSGLRLATGQAKSPQDAWRQSREFQSVNADDFQKRRPTTTAVIKGTGTGASAFVPGGAALNVFKGGTLAGNMGRGALAASGNAFIYGAAEDGSLSDRGDRATAAATNPFVLGLGAAGGALAPRVLPTPKPKVRGDGDVLAEVGVSTSIPQRGGRSVKGAEDLMRRGPIVGQAMAGYQDRQIEQLNRAVGLEAMKRIGGGIPKEIKPGFEMVEYVDDALGAVYDRAAKMVPAVRLDKDLSDEFGEIAKRAVDLPESEAAQFQRIINDRTARLQDGASGEMVKKIHGELGALQAEAARKGQTTLAGMLGDTRRSIMGLVERASPEAGALIKQADEGWGIYSMMNDAAAAASARGGVFLPGQLNTQVRGSARRMGTNMAGKGKGPLQEIATAASRTIPDTYGNPGTSNALGVGGFGVGLMTEPATTLAVGAGLTAAATPYFLMGRKVLEELPPNASPRQLSEAADRLAVLASKDPAVNRLRQEVAARLSSGAGAVGGSQASASPNYFAQP